MPACRTADTFWGSPPIAPTEPSSCIVPVTATSTPPSRSPSVNSSSRVRVNANPALGPPISPVSKAISKGSRTDVVSNGTNPMIPLPASVGRLHQLDVDVDLADVDPVDGDGDCVTRRVVLQRDGQIVDRVDVRSVDGHDGVALVELLCARDVLEAALALDVEAQHLLDLHRTRDQLGFVAGQREGDELGDLTRRAHHLQGDRSPLRRRLRPELLLAGEEADLRLVPGNPPTEYRLRRLGDRDEENSAVGIGVDSHVGAEVGVRHPVGDGLHCRGDDGVRRVLVDRFAIAIDLFAGNETGGQQGGDHDRHEHEQRQGGERDRPKTSAGTGQARAWFDVSRRRQRQCRH